MKKVIVTVVAIAAVIGAVFTVKSCKLIKTGQTGIVYTYRDGVQDQTLSPGLNFVGPMKKVKQFSTSNEILVMSKDKREGSKKNEAFKVATSDDASIAVSFQMSYRYNPENTCIDVLAFAVTTFDPPIILVMFLFIFLTVFILSVKLLFDTENVYFSEHRQKGENMNILFLNQSETVTATVKKLSVHLIEITGTEPNTSGFHLLNNAGNVFGKYDGFTTLYRELEDGFILSDDGSVYVEPIEPEPEPEPEISLDEVKEAKVSEMNDIQQKLIAQGVDVTLSDGSKEHFSLTERDQTSLVGLQAQVAIGAENIPWHTSDEDEHCKFYSNADMAKITSSALSYVTWHITYFRDLRIYIRSLESKEEVEQVTYGMTIPEVYQSEPLKAMLAQKS